jgi:flagellar hook assembly protein FlgD
VGAYPNPFNPRTTVAFELAQSQDVRLAVYDLAGTRIRWLLQEPRPVGRHEVVWNGLDSHGRRVASGVYVLRLEAGTIRDLRKVVLLK